MASSGYNLNPFPYLPSPSTASYNLPLSLPSLLSCDPSSANNNNSTFNIHQPHQDPVSFLAPYFPIGHFSATSTPPETMINFAVSRNNIQALGNIPSGPAGGKKDRHSKIYTAQGLRDRRVRLSIDIARKFFDLQDMLGYDKASKTLEWLFSKSKKAIKDLSRTKHFGANNYGGARRMSLDSDVEEEEEEEQGEEEGGWGLKMKSMLSINEEDKASKRVEVFHLLSKESRAKARERTMDMKQVLEHGDEKIFGLRKSGEEEVSNLSMDESVFMNKRKICAKKFIKDSNAKPDSEISQRKLLDQVKASKGLLQEPSMIKRKWRPSINSASPQTNLLISIDGLPINFSQNWDNSSSNPNYPFAK